jgi:hypothetical protein
MGDKVERLGKEAEILAYVEIALKREIIHEIDGNIDRLCKIQDNNGYPGRQAGEYDNRGGYHGQTAEKSGPDLCERWKSAGRDDEIIENGGFKCVREDQQNKAEDRQTFPGNGGPPDCIPCKNAWYL